MSGPQAEDAVCSSSGLRPGGGVGEKKSLWLLQGGALLVLLIGCVNVVNLFLARLNAKRR